MIAGQTSRGENDKQNFLFPLPSIYISQGENGGYSHKGSYAIDFLGWGSSGRIYTIPYYAPFDCKCVLKDSANAYVWESLDVVNFVNGVVDYASICVAHDDDYNRANLGDIRRQGEILGQTGTSPKGKVTGDHVHIEIAKGKYAGRFQNSYGVWMLRNSISVYRGCGINDTIIYKGNNYGWQDFDHSQPSPQPWRPTSDNDLMYLLISNVI